MIALNKMTENFPALESASHPPKIGIVKHVPVSKK